MHVCACMCVPSLVDPSVICHHLLCFPEGSTPDCCGLTPVNATDGWREGRIDRGVDGLIDGSKRWETINHRGRALLITAKQIRWDCCLFTALREQPSISRPFRTLKSCQLLLSVIKNQGSAARPLHARCTPAAPPLHA